MKLNNICVGYLVTLLIFTGAFISWRLTLLYFIGIFLITDKIHDLYRLRRIDDEELSHGQDKFVKD